MMLVAFRLFSAFQKLILALGWITLVVVTSTTSAQEMRGESIRATAESSADGQLPQGLKRFSGMLIGTLHSRDIEHGCFTVRVQYVSRVWENNKAREPRSVVGKTVKVNGVTGKWLDELLLVRRGETLEFEAQHREGDELTFPGEWLKKVPTFDPSQHPVPPSGFRGFAGLVTGRVVTKNTTSREIHLRIDGIEKSFPKNKAKSPDDVIGKEIVLAGFWARMSKPFEPLEKGDRIRAGVLHRVPQSDHFTVIDVAEKIGPASAEKPTDQKTNPESSSAFPSGMKGFRGILRGKLISKDVEKGTLVFQASRVTRTWKQNRARDTNSAKDRKFLVKGISGKWLDVLITLKAGDKIEVEAFHHAGDQLDFIGEWLKKVE